MSEDFNIINIVIDFETLYLFFKIEGTTIK